MVCCPFITFEGGEGVGKSTQIKHLESSLKSKGYDVVVTREPGGCPSAEEIRNLLSHKNYGGRWTPEAELMLLFAARSMHIKEVIAPALKVGKIVLCDRYIDSTRVYQGYIQKLDINFIKSLENQIVGDYMPNLTLILDITPQEAMRRVHSRGVQDHYDMGDEAFYEALRQGFLNIVKDNPMRCVMLDASQNENSIAAKILKVVEEKLQ